MPRARPPGRIIRHRPRYISTHSAGRVYVFDSATGFHQFQDTAICAVPEPAICAAGIAGVLVIVLLRRRCGASR